MEKEGKGEKEKYDRDNYTQISSLFIKCTFLLVYFFRVFHDEVIS